MIFKRFFVTICSLNFSLHIDDFFILFGNTWVTGDIVMVIVGNVTFIEKKMIVLVGKMTFILKAYIVSQFQVAKDYFTCM